MAAAGDVSNASVLRQLATAWRGAPAVLEPGCRPGEWSTDRSANRGDHCRAERQQRARAAARREEAGALEAHLRADEHGVGGDCQRFGRTEQGRLPVVADVA